jgi:hypothetical protein
VHAVTNLAKEAGNVRTPRFRFSIRGIFILTLGVAVGLAWRQVAGSSIADALLSAFAAWLAIGMFQYAAQRWRSGHDGGQASGQSGAQRPEAVAAIAIGIVVPLCLILSAIHGHLLVLDDGRDVRWVPHGTEAFGEAALLLAICCGYWLTLETPASANRRRSAGTRTISALALLVGALWMSWLLFHETLITSLVHVAIQGVKNYQPTRWVGHLIHDWSPTDKLVGNFVRRGYLSAGILVVGIWLVVSMRRHWERGPWVRSLLAAATIMCVAAEVFLLAWCRAVLPRIAPLEADLVGGQPLVSQFQALVLICISATAVAWRLTAVRLPATAAMDRHGDNQATHLRPSVIWLGVVVILWQYLNEVHLSALSALNFSSLAEYAIAGSLMEPLAILQLALLIILISSLRRRRRGKDVWRPVRWSVDPAMFMTTWFLSFCIALLVPAVGAWYGVTLYLYLGMT